MTLLALPIKRIGLTLCLCLALIASLVIHPVRAAAAPARSTVVQWATSLLKVMNGERAVHGLQPLQGRVALVSIAHKHNSKMAVRNLASHQLPGELAFRTRIASAGYAGGTGGENLAQTRNWTLVGAKALQHAMYASTSASDGRRENILNKSYRYVGIDLMVDTVHHKLWLTQDFSRASTVRAAAVPATVTMAVNMLHSMNAERALHGLVQLRMNSRLILSAHRHNVTMSLANLMSHQLPNEAVFSTRISAAGYNWQAAGENIGYTSAPTMTNLYGLQRMMYNEVAPADGHRQNILSKSFRDVGIDVFVDAHHTLWFTQDLGLAI